MNFKKSIILIFIFSCFILCVGAVSAENITADDAQNVTQENDISAGAVESAEVTSQKVSTKKIDTDTDADDMVVTYKKNNYFKVKVKNDDTDKPVKKLKLKLKVYTKSKSKTYYIKTNSKGVAKFNTKNLGLGNHKIVITSADDSYIVNENAYIFVGKKYTTTMKPNTVKKLKNKDALMVYTKNDGDEKEIKVAFKGTAKKSNIIKAVFYLKNKSTGKLIKKIDYTDDFENGKWEYPDEDYSYKYEAVKVRITYVTV